MSITLRRDTIWPKSWSFPGSCAVTGSLCASGAGATITVNRDFPCDQVSTTSIELCIQPVALIQGAARLSSCPGTGLQIDGSRSTGSGIKPLTFAWSANPTTTDNYPAVQAALLSLGGASKISLPGSAVSNQTTTAVLDNGNTFVFVLVRRFACEAIHPLVCLWHGRGGAAHAFLFRRTRQLATHLRW